MSEDEILALLGRTLTAFQRLDFARYAGSLAEARSAVAAAGDPPALLGEWKLLAALPHYWNLEQLLPLLKEAAALLGGPSRALQRKTPLLLGAYHPFGVFWRTPGTADSAAGTLEEVEGVWSRLTGGGQGTAALYRAQLCYYRGALREALALAADSFGRGAAHEQLYVQLGAADLLGHLSHHGINGACTEPAMRFVRRSCEAEDRDLRKTAELVRSNIYLAFGVLSETPDWIKNGDFGAASQPEPPGFSMLEDKLPPVLVEPAMLHRVQYLTFCGRYIEALAAADTLQLVYRSQVTLNLIYLDFWRRACYAALGDAARSREAMRRVVNGCSADDLWLIPAEYEPGLPLLEQLAAEHGPHAAEQVRTVGSGLWNKLTQLREVYLQDSMPEALTAREQEVMALVGSGCTNAQAAQRLHVSEETVKSHLKNIFSKVNVSDRRQLSELLGRTREAATAVWAKEMP